MYNNNQKEEIWLGGGGCHDDAHILVAQSLRTGYDILNGCQYMKIPFPLSLRFAISNFDNVREKICNAFVLG